MEGKVKEILLQKRGAVEIKAYVNRKSVTICAESKSGGLNGINIMLNASVVRQLIFLARVALESWVEEG